MIDFTFEQAPWEAALKQLNPGDSIPSLRFLALMAEESEEVVEEVLMQLELRSIRLDISDLPKAGHTGEAALRLQMEDRLPKTGDIRPLLEDLQAPQPQEELVRQELHRTMERLLSMLDERQRQILRLHFGIEDDTCYSLAEIGAMLGISKERARQIEQQAMEKLKKLGADMGLEDFLDD